MNKLGKYIIRRTLGKGAMGIVYEGFDPEIERVVAIKTILPSQLEGAQYGAVMARFKREAQAAGRLNHQGIVAIYDYGIEAPEELSEEEATLLSPPLGGKPADRIAYIAMEFIKGRELKDFFDKSERFRLEDIARIMGEILDALDHAHAQGVVHRDMKPANLIVLDPIGAGPPQADGGSLGGQRGTGSDERAGARLGHVKIADFGIAHVEESQLTRTGTLLGTPAYMSPEQFMGHPVDGRSDLFSCGVILYQLLTGERPFTGESTTTVMYKVMREDPVPPSHINLSLAPEIDAVVHKALAKNVNQRFHSGKEFAQALRAAVDAQARPSASGAPVAATAAAMTPMPPVPAPQAGSAPVAAAAAGRKSMQAVWAVAAVAVIGVAAGMYALFGGRTSTAPPSQAQASAPAPSAAPSTAPSTALASAPAAALVAQAPAPAAPPPTEPGTMILSALGVVDAQDARFKGDAAAAQAEARNAAKRQLVEKALALYVEGDSLEANRKVIEAKLLSDPGHFIRSVVQEGAADTNGNFVEMPTRAVVSVRDVQRSLNELSREERIDFIRRQGDPRISIRIDIGNAEGPAIGRERSQLAENVVKERIKSFGFRVWSGDGDNPNAANAQQADFAIKGDVKLKTMSMKLAASGLTIGKSAITSWTLKAIDTGTGEEVYLNTKMPAGQSWASEDQALAAIGRLVGDEFSKNFFLSFYNYRPQRTSLAVTGLPEGMAPLVLRELRALRTVLDAQAQGARFALQLPPGNAADIVQDAVLGPLNSKMGRACFGLGGATATEVTVTYDAGCANAQMRSKLEGGAPAGWKFTPASAKTT
ncbi:MAG TPA: serine/threonine-protein kinase [Ramlibacter sp.]|uniref:serine/threonine-protein kinase n=1 Tax=Ramlibacter sp. TaxID=1917967 RepID=UPI002BEE4EF9|nr:serine/threonine-protein kinase [Ramlibacter sp.]HVZ45304.1 serine/threonine-protein kinase [Ramlibacter sp.]